MGATLEDPARPLGQGQIAPLVRIVFTAFVAVLVPFYWEFYGPANFLWFCDIALLLTVAALWLESPFLASMQLVSVFVGCLAWLVDFLVRLASGSFLLRMTVYMFREDIPLIIRVLSLYHGWLPFLLLWMVWKLGYDRRAWIAQTVLAWLVLPVCYFCTDPVRALNGVFGPSGEHPQTWMAPRLYLALMMGFYPLAIYLPSHLAFRAFTRRRSGRRPYHA
jgi:hypothetical protein